MKMNVQSSSFSLVSIIALTCSWVNRLLAFSMPSLMIVTMTTERIDASSRVVEKIDDHLKGTPENDRALGAVDQDQSGHQTRGDHLESRQLD